ncbi:hypothetical protein IJG78_01285 [Candidatus Saccharibacteria bacterium]|nr:hypothetical protein [Candidatus Saccharibacteria bacterium]
MQALALKIAGNYLLILLRPRKNHCFSTGSIKARRYPLSYIYSGLYYWGGVTWTIRARTVSGGLFRLFLVPMLMI